MDGAEEAAEAAAPTVKAEEEPQASVDTANGAPAKQPERFFNTQPPSDAEVRVGVLALSL